MRPSSLRDSCKTGSKVLEFDPRPITGGFFEIKAYAKLNLFLDVLEKRPDGYHDIVSVMQSIDLHDDLKIYRTGNAQGFIFFTNSDEVPNDDSNLVARAAKLLIDEYKIKESLVITLTKRIPVGAGLAGGSADCAATLKGIDRLLKLNIPFDELQDIAASLGADVPFCLVGGTCLAGGIGEKLTQLSPHPECSILLAFPGIHVSTKKIFEKLCVSSRNQNKKKLENILSSLRNNELTEVALSLYNVFTDLTSREFPVVGTLITKLNTCGAIGASMTGTGSAVFGYFARETDAIKAQQALEGETKTYLVKPFNRS